MGFIHKDRGAPEGIAAFLLILRYLASVALAIILFLNFFWHFMPYSQRSLPERQPNWWWFLAIMLAGGFLLTLGMTRHRFRVCFCLLLTLFAANAVMIVNIKETSLEQNKEGNDAETCVYIGPRR